MSQIIQISGNKLGSARAEADTRMLDGAFVETSDYLALKDTDDFNFIVGRRGTGKTALYLRLKSELSHDDRLRTHLVKPQEYDSLALVGVIRSLGLSTYAETRSALQVLWRISIAFTVAVDLCNHWKFKDTLEGGILNAYIQKRKHLRGTNELSRCYSILKDISRQSPNPEELPRLIAVEFELSVLEDAVRSGLEMTQNKAVFLFDGLDEGWGTETLPIGILGGLAIAISGFRDSGLQVHGALFIRDNIFRSLAVHDSDYSRHIEGSTLRLHWDEDTLFNFITNRLRLLYSMQEVESNVRVWNRFAHRELSGREGFQRCLKLTLYRPRDLLVLLNNAIVRSNRAGRTVIIDEDIESTAKQVSLDRLADLVKEYESVFPGLSIITNSLIGTEAFQPLGSMRCSLQSLVEKTDYKDRHSGDIAILGNGSQLLDVLYSIGLLGLVDPNGKAVRFCHDGANSGISELPGDRRVAIHPCYWKAMDARNVDVSPEVLVEIHDDYEVRQSKDTLDLRVRRLGNLLTDLTDVPIGTDGASAFEKWVLRTCQVLFAGNLSNFDLHPNEDSTQRRDVVATNNAESGFWKRVLLDYGSRHIVFEAKNYRELTLNDFRQALSYSGQQYGKFTVIVHRSDNEGLSPRERNWVKEMWDQHEVLIMTIPTVLVKRCITKTKNPQRGKRSYVERMLTKRIDTFERNYVALKSG